MPVETPIDRYKVEDPFSNHPLFKTEEQARLEETMDGVEPDFAEASVETVLAWPGESGAGESRPVEVNIAEEQAPPADVEDSGFWRADRARDFDWGD
jgi:hypothetical protein